MRVMSVNSLNYNQRSQLAESPIKNNQLAFGAAQIIKEAAKEGVIQATLLEKVGNKLDDFLGVENIKTAIDGMPDSVKIVFQPTSANSFKATYSVEVAKSSGTPQNGNLSLEYDKPVPDGIVKYFINKILG